MVYGLVSYLQSSDRRGNRDSYLDNVFTSRRLPTSACILWEVARGDRALLSVFMPFKVNWNVQELRRWDPFDWYKTRSLITSNIPESFPDWQAASRRLRVIVELTDAQCSRGDRRREWEPKPRKALRVKLNDAS